MTAGIQLLLGLVSLANLVLSYLQKRGDIEAAKGEVIAGHLQGVRDAVMDARKTKTEVAERISGPDGKPDPDKLRNDTAGLWRK